MEELIRLAQGDLAVAVVGALIALGGGLIGIIIQSGRAHTRWLREKRYDACRDFLALALELRAVQDSIDADEEAVKESGANGPVGEREQADALHMHERLEQLSLEAHRALAAMLAIGPGSLAEAAQELFATGMPDRGEIEDFSEVARGILKSAE